MPRDDLSIDFVRRMPPGGEILDPALILDEWINRVQNLPEEIRFIQEEIAEKDRIYNECVKTIEDRDGRIQKFIKANGSHEPFPKEEGYRQTIRENFAKADKLANEKIALTQKLQYIMDKHLKNLDVQIKLLYDRAEPGFTDPDELPSLLRPSAANQTQPSARSVNAATNPITNALNNIPNGASQTALRAANPQVRAAQSQQQISASAPATPAASMIMARKERENSAGPGSGVPKRGPRSNTGIGSAPTQSSGLARHSSLGPGTPKATNQHHTAAATGVPRAGSAGPRASSKAGGVNAVRKSATPSGPGRKKGTPAPGGTTAKSGLSRVKRAAKNSPSSNADSELSDAESGSADESDARRSARGTPAARAAPSGGSNKGGGADGGHDRDPPKGPPHRHPTPKGRPGVHDDDDDDAMDVDDDDAGDDKKYCICQNVSYGDMVACDNEDCPFEWFHWSCVGLKSEPNGTWYCPVCTEKKKKQQGK
ncbi:inhibitor of growth proteins N-terminal histone-binding-domain-containing protein [Coniochaeta sp. 2T2.1]|nr:inhibitor of growth proteins N-terminal histone-binding-domain-containing protein [Coniochaeta sp. 2T2.1]